MDYLEKRINNAEFIEGDPVCIPHMFSKLQDREISGLFAALLAWGQRKTIIKNAEKLMQLMDFAPHDFIVHHREQDRQRFEKFVHRTFQFDDLLYFLEFLQFHYKQHPSLETAFSDGMSAKDETVENGLKHFHRYFFSLPHLHRTEKHLQTPERKSACKRLNLYLRWMVRHDNAGVDFGIWKQIKMHQLICPLDVHVHRAAWEMGLLSQKQANWQAALELTQNLKSFDSEDPVRYDYALFGYSMYGGKLEE